MLAYHNCRNPGAWDYGLFTVAEVGDRFVTNLQNQISQMPPSNYKTIAVIASMLSMVAFRATKIIINEPLCHKIDLSEKKSMPFNSAESIMLSHQ